MKTVLVTGFGAYEEEPDNPSGLIATRLDGLESSGVLVRGTVLPVATARVGDALADAIASCRPDVVVILGVTPGRSSPAVERVAINVRDFPIPDNDGATPIDEPIVDDGPDAYFSTLPVKAILARWRHEGIPGFVSNTAGTYVCNQTFYLARHLARKGEVRTGLIHIPLASESVAAMSTSSPSLPLQMLEDAVRIAAIVATSHKGRDEQLGAGATG